MAVLQIFAAWYISDGLIHILHSGRNCLNVIWRMVPVLFILRTFVTPWKQIRDHKNYRGFNLELWMQRVCLNLVSRMVGMVFRTVLLIVGILLFACTIVMIALALVVWIALPVVLIFFLGALALLM